MPIEIEYRCNNCHRFVSWVYDEDEDKIKSDTLTGCPGQDCTVIHNISAQKIDDDKS